LSTNTQPHGPAMPYDSLKVPFFIPLLIGPPATLACGTLGHAWIGLLVAVAGTFYVVRDALHYPAPTRRNLSSLGLALFFVRSGSH